MKSGEVIFGGIAILALGGAALYIIAKSRTTTISSAPLGVAKTTATAGVPAIQQKQPTPGFLSTIAGDLFSIGSSAVKSAALSGGTGAKQIVGVDFNSVPDIFAPLPKPDLYTGNVVPSDADLASFGLPSANANVQSGGLNDFVPSTPSNFNNFLADQANYSGSSGIDESTLFA
jgi:hypothetical protein